MNETLTTRLLSETFEFLETTFRGELALIDHGLAWTIHLVIGLLFLVPVLQAIGRRLGRVFANDAPQTVLVCARCREEVHEHCVRCPSCEHVFPSSFLRACATVAVVLLAWWTAGQRDSPLLFQSLLGVYAAIVVLLGAFALSGRLRESRVGKAGQSTIDRVVGASVRVRELWTRAEVFVRALLLLAFYVSLLIGLQHTGLPTPMEQTRFPDVLSKLAFLSALLAFTSLAVLFRQLRHFHGFATLVLAVASLLFFTGTALTSHALANLARPAAVDAPEKLAFSVTRRDSGELLIERRDARGRWIQARLVEPSGTLRFRTSLLVIPRFGYRRYFLAAVEGAPSLPSAREVAAGRSWSEALLDPRKLAGPIYVAAAQDSPPDWIRRLDVRVDPQPPRTWRVEVPAGKTLRVYVDGTRIFTRLEGSESIVELEHF